MPGIQLYMIHAPEDRESAESILNEVLADWPIDRQPTIHLVMFDELRKIDQPGSNSIAWIYTKDYKIKTDIYLSLELVEEWLLPTLLTRTEEILPAGSTFRDGVIIGPEGCGADQFRMMLLGIASQVGMLKQMSVELTLTQRQNANMQSEFSRIEEELRMAASLQREFLPMTLPSDDEVGFKVLFRPASYVSGDIYDIRQVDEDHIAFYLADAVGHGVPAALMTIFIRHALLNAQASWTGEGHIPPSEALSVLNKQLLRRQQQSVQFATACYALLNTKTGELEYASAGHPPAFWLKGDGQVSQLEADGPLLGVFENEPFGSAKIQLEAGDRFLMYTDGFEMAFGDKTQVANTDYVEELYQLGKGCMNDAMDRLIEHIDSHTGSLHQRDDLTALLLGYENGEVRSDTQASTVVEETGSL